MNDFDEKKISNKLIIDAIIDKFGSVDSFAESIGTSRQNVYNKIGRQSSKFFKLLKDNGVALNYGVQIGKSKIENNKGSISIGSDLSKENESLKKEVEMLREIIKGKDRVIQLLENR